MKLFELAAPSKISRINIPDRFALDKIQWTRFAKAYFDDRHIKMPDLLKDVLGVSEKDFVGGGAYASVFKKSPGTVMRIGKYDPKGSSDAHMNFISHILENNLISNNPYFPRIYKALIVRVPVKPNQYDESKKLQYQYVYVTEMEKLVPFSKLDEQQLEAIADRIFDTKMADYLKNKQDLVIDIPETLHILLSKNKLQDIKDPKLKQALEHIDETYGALDIHEENIMVRLTNIGPQLVLTDPKQN